MKRSRRPTGPLYTHAGERLARGDSRHLGLAAGAAGPRRRLVI